MTQASGWIVRLLVAPLLASACGSRPEEVYSRAHSDSGITGPGYPAIVDELRNLQTSYPALAETVVYGKSVRGKDLTVIKIRRQDVQPQGRRPAVMITGTIHGDEFLNIENRMPRWFLENQNKPGVAAFLAAGGVIYVAPILNPDGYAADRRENDKGKDLNRDFDLKRAQKTGFGQPETKALSDFLKQEAQTRDLDLRLTLDYHCCVGALIYPWGHSASDSLPAKDLAEHKRMAKKMLSRFSNYPSGQAMQIVGYTALGASDDWFHETYGAVSFTFEGAYGREDRNFELHGDMWNEILADKAGPPATGQPPTGTATQTLVAAVIADDGASQVRLALGADANTSAMGICRGDLATCSGAGAQNVVRLPEVRRVGDRTVHTGGGWIQADANQSLVLLAFDAGGRVTAARAIRIARR